MERPQQVTSFQTLNFRNMDTRPREGSEGTSIPNLPKHHTYKSRTSCEMEESFGLLPGSPGKKLELEEGEAKIGGMEKSAASIYGHLPSCGQQNLNEDEVTDPFPGGKAILKRVGRKHLSELGVDSLGAGSPTGLCQCQAGWDGGKCHQPEKAGRKRGPKLGPNLPSTSPRAELPPLLGLSYPR